MVRIYKDFTFEAAHQLEGYEGACANVHGHSYKLRVGLSGMPEEGRGPSGDFLMDFSIFKKRVKEIFLDEWDHSFLARGDEAILPALKEHGSKIVNLGFRPTAENMCRHILWELHLSGLPVESVILHETETSCAEARLEDLICEEYRCPNEKLPDINRTLPISEIFGPTIQGEGALIGKKSIFLRTYGCDDKCSWCDTGYAWDGQEQSKRMTLSEIHNSIEGLSADSGCHHVTITGGNPCIHGASMGDLLKLLKSEGFTLALETQGTALPDWLGLLDSVTLSPKAPSSRNITEEAGLLRFISMLRGAGVSYSIKIVVFDDEDYDYAKRIYRADCLTDDFFLQPGNPEGEFDLTQAIGRYESLVKKALGDSELNNVRVLPQLHTWLWGNEREV